MAVPAVGKLTKQLPDFLQLSEPQCYAKHDSKIVIFIQISRKYTVARETGVILI